MVAMDILMSVKLVLIIMNVTLIVISLKKQDDSQHQKTTHKKTVVQAVVGFNVANTEHYIIHVVIKRLELYKTMDQNVVVIYILQ